MLHWSRRRGEAVGDSTGRRHHSLRSMTTAVMLSRLPSSSACLTSASLARVAARACFGSETGTGCERWVWMAWPNTRDLYERSRSIESTGSRILNLQLCHTGRIFACVHMRKALVWGEKGTGLERERHWVGARKARVWGEKGTGLERESLPFLAVLLSYRRARPISRRRAAAVCGPQGKAVS